VAAAAESVVARVLLGCAMVADLATGTIDEA